VSCERYNRAYLRHHRHWNADVSHGPIYRRHVVDAFLARSDVAVLSTPGDVPRQPALPHPLPIAPTVLAVGHEDGEAAADIAEWTSAITIGQERVRVRKG